MATIGVLLVDDHSIVRIGLAGILEDVKNIRVLAEAETGQKAIDLYERVNPDITILDITMPDMDGIQVCRKILEIDINAKLIIMTMHLTEEYLNRALSAGVSGYLLKNTGKEELVSCIKNVMAGKRVFSKDVSDFIACNYAKKDQSPEKQLNILTKREKEILAMIIDGKTNHLIASELFISPRTVEAHRANMMNKLGTNNVAALVRMAIENNLI